MVRAHRFNCNPKTAEQWEALGCVFASPSATTAFDLGTHNRVTPTTSCEVACTGDGEDFAIIRITGELEAIAAGIGCGGVEPHRFSNPYIPQV